MSVFVWSVWWLGTVIVAFAMPGAMLTVLTSEALWRRFVVAITLGGWMVHQVRFYRLLRRKAER